MLLQRPLPDGPELLALQGSGPAICPRHRSPLEFDQWRVRDARSTVLRLVLRRLHKFWTGADHSDVCVEWPTAFWCSRYSRLFWCAGTAPSQYSWAAGRIARSISPGRKTGRRSTTRRSLLPIPNCRTALDGTEPYPSSPSLPSTGSRRPPPVNNTRFWGHQHRRSKARR